MPRKWKSCVAKVTAKNSVWCQTHGYPFDKDPSGKKCVHPYKVCSYLRNQYDEERPVSPRASSPKKKVYTGPRGGKYYISGSGNKVYIKG